MEFFDFITDDELRDLPLDDPERAFVEFVRLADRKLQSRISEVGQEEYGGQAVEEAQYGFQNVVYSAARHFGIEPFAQEQVPLRQNYGWEVYRQFRANLSHYVAQIMFRTVSAERNDSAALTEPVRASLREHIAELRKAIDASGLSETRKAALHKRLDALELELAKSRVRFVVVASAVFTILSVPGALWDSYEAVAKITAMIMRDVGEAKTVEDDDRRPVAPETPAALQAPRPTKLQKPSDMDDEIPF